MRNFFDPSPPVLAPADLVLAFTKRKASELALPRRAIIVFDGRDLNLLVKEAAGKPVEEWSSFRRIYRAEGKETILTKCRFGGPNIAALVEELSSFGVSEFCLWGYCGAVDTSVAVGDVVLVLSAAREDGVSYHYLPGGDTYVHSKWAREWEGLSRSKTIMPGRIWSCDALYREGRDKAAKYASEGVLGVEMEVASFYAVCLAKDLKAVAFLVVSDLVHETGWKAGFGSAELRRGARRLADFILEYVIV